MRQVLVVVALCIALSSALSAAEQAGDQPSSSEQAQQQQLRRARIVNGLFLAAGVALVAVDLRSENRGVSWAASGAWVGVAATTLWEIRIRGTRHSAVVVNRGLGYRIGW